jgi:predicted DNA-binding transcriptional regulator YafY
MATLDQDIMTILPMDGHGKAISTREVHNALMRTGIEVPSIKTIQRRLFKLEESGHVDGMLQGRSLFWHRRKGVHGLGHGRNSMMSFDDALALKILGRFSTKQLPTFVAQSLQPMFEAATHRLSSPKNDLERSYAKWIGKVAVEDGSFRLIVPTIDPDILAIVTRALFQEHRLIITYRPRCSGGPESCRAIAPLGLVEVSGIVYLVGTGIDQLEPKMYRLDRMFKAEMSVESFNYPVEFSLDAYVKEQRQFDFMTEGKTRIFLRFKNKAGEHLLESLLSQDQTHQINGEYLDVQGSVTLSRRLRWWIRSFGPDVEVIEPEALRDEFSNEAKRLLETYRAGPA